eukprot:TRINITY_DN6300_c0_g1_i2.p1 TRINITY_DN6300_c0_g1~~TRINITY_DN6300_c0_g1_i2.p1  ORF type:complete len:436 (+),score=130.64 TRINITY_DN6300_c0_g1_i2:23-1309(+)
MDDGSEVREMVTTDKFKLFKRLRAAERAAGEKEIERVMNLFKMASFNLQQSDQENTGGWRKSWSKKPAIAPVSVNEDGVDLNTATHCGICAVAFSRIWGVGEKPFQCPLCASIVCGKHSSHSLPPPSFGKTQRLPDMRMCDTCYIVVMKGKEREEFNLSKERANSEPIAMNFEALARLTKTISEDVPRLRDMVYDIGDQHTTENTEDIQIALHIDKDLSEFFAKFDKVLKHLATMSPTTPKEQKLFQNYKSAHLTFITETLPEFRILHKQLATVASMKPVKPPPPPEVNSKTIQSGPPPKKSNKTLPKVPTGLVTPIIKTINPVVLPPEGGRILIEGQNFSNSVMVSINRMSVPCEYVDSTELIVHAPKMGQGFKDIKVSNPGGSHATLEQVLLYSADLPTGKEQSGRLYEDEEEVKPKKTNSERRAQ